MHEQIHMLLIVLVFHHKKQTVSSVATPPIATLLYGVPLQHVTQLMERHFKLVNETLECLMANVLWLP